MIAHIAGLPAEELLLAFGGPGAGLVVARGWIMVQVRRRKTKQ